jgi:3-dehydroquinate synthase
MVDASIGGKNGVDLGALKNQIGIIKTPVMVLIDTSFLNSLPQRDLRSGLAEMIKHGLISNPKHYSDLQNLSNLTLEDLDWLIYDSINVKKEIVEKDPTEQNLRKTLNFGHTLGHAVESYCLAHPQMPTLLHGEAIAIGMVLEAYLSRELTGLSTEALEDIKSTMDKFYKKIDFTTDQINAIIELLKFDKKNSHGNINFVLLESIGTCKIDIKVENNLIFKAFDYYKL